MIFTKLNIKYLKTEINIATIAPKQVFWDMDISQLSIKEDKTLIIPRMLLSTTKETFPKDITNLEKAYSTKEIYNVLKSTKERISNNVCRMVAIRYNKPTFLRYKF